MSTILRHDGLLHEITEGRMIGKPTRRRRLQVLHDLTEGDGYAALKQAAEERKGWRYSGVMSRPAVQLKTKEGFLESRC